MKSRRVVIAVVAVSASTTLSSVCWAMATTANANPPLRTYNDFEVLEVVPHDVSSFTQGLTYFDGLIYEGTGLYGNSHVLAHDPTDGMRTLRKFPLRPDSAFGEGISHYSVNNNDVVEHRLIQITWKEKLGLIYELPLAPENDIADGHDVSAPTVPVREFTFGTHTGEGWGITFRAETSELYVSDGSEHLFVWDADTLEEKRRMKVTFRGNYVRGINELEFVDYGDGSGGGGEDKGRECGAEHGNAEDGVCADDNVRDGGGGSNNNQSTTSPRGPRILANVWYEDVIISIDPKDGTVLRVYDLRELYPHETRAEGADCLNGISVVAAEGEGATTMARKDEFWVTGKFWPYMYRIRLID